MGGGMLQGRRHAAVTAAGLTHHRFRVYEVPLLQVSIKVY
jgi:hypothetical protein